MMVAPAFLGRGPSPPKKSGCRRAQRRTAVRLGIACRRFSSSGDGASSEGELLNYCDSGIFIITPQIFHTGTVLVVRVTSYPGEECLASPNGEFRSILLGEVRWQKKIEDEITVRYGMGLKYLF